LAKDCLIACRNQSSTEAGSCLREFARKILINIADARHCVDDLKRDITGRLVVGAVPTISPYVLPDLIAKFQQRHPKVVVEILEDTTESLALRLEDGTLDAAIMSNCDESLTLQRHSLGKEALLLLLPAGHRFAKKKKIRWSDLKSQKFLLLQEMHCLSTQVHELLATHQLQPEPPVRGAQPATITQMVAADMGVTLVPKMMIERELASGCVALPFATPIPVRELNLLRNPLRLESKAAAAFRREAADAFLPKGYRSLAT
jgi:LysR family transcriptional regulator, hydrogen peroxide-inducible genes activator